MTPVRQHITCVPSVTLRALAALIDKNGDGVIDYQEFLPVCFSMIVEILSDKVRAAGDGDGFVRVLGLLWVWKSAASSKFCPTGRVALLSLVLHESRFSMKNLLAISADATTFGRPSPCRCHNRNRPTPTRQRRRE